MLRIGMVDDDSNFLKYLSSKITEINNELHVEVTIETFLNGEDLIKRNDENEFHIIMIDLEMPIMDGLSVAGLLRENNTNFVLISITNRSDLVFKSFEYDATGFIRKNHLDEELKSVLDRSYQKALSRMTNYVFKTENGERIFQNTAICYFLSKGHQIFLFDNVENGIRILTTLEKLEDLLSPISFIRCHSGIIVNCMYIYSINSSDIELTNGQKLPLSRHRAKSVKQSFQKYLRSL